MKDTKITYTCDVCKEVINDYCTTTRRYLDVIFITEQTEGRCVKPYIDKIALDVCEKCMEHLLTGNYIYAHGAQGHNEYYFKGKGKDKWT